MSPRIQVIAPLALASLLAAAKPYEDTRGRFKVELPAGWAIAPQFGDTSGMVFQKKVVARRGSSLATLIVHVDDFPANDIKEYADKMEGELKSQPGFSRAGEHGGLVGGKPAIVRELRALISKKPRLEKTIEAYFLESSGHMYMLHFESPSTDFARVKDDIKTMLATFTPLARARDDGGAIGLDKIDAPAPNLNGRWINDDKLILVLGGDGSFALADAAGRYEVKDGTLTLIIPGQGRESFSFVHDAGAGTLTLSSANLGAPMVYRKMSGAAPATAGHTPPRDSAPRDPAPGGLTGKWSTPTPSGPLSLELQSDKSFTMGTMKGQWSATAEKLTLAHDGAELIVYRFRVAGDRLALSGGDLDGEVVFQRDNTP